MTTEPKTGTDPEVEEDHRALYESAGLFTGGARALIRVEGKRAQEMISGLVTNHVAGLDPGRALYAFLLTPKGRPVAELRALVRDGQHLLLDMPAACRDGALEHLKKYLPPIYAEFAPDEDLSRLSVIGPRSGEAVARAVEAFAAGSPSGSVPPSITVAPDELDPLQFTELAVPGNGSAGDGGAGLLVRREPIEGPGFDLYLPSGALVPAREALEEAVGRAGGRSVGESAYEIWRVERGIPVYGPEIDTDALPQETGQQERAIDFESGCYTGQEVVARIHYRGKVNRRLVGLRLPEETLPPSGHELYADDRVRGTITSAVLSPRFGPIALGYVRRELEIGEALALEKDGTPDCRITGLPFGDD